MNKNIGILQARFLKNSAVFSFNMTNKSLFITEQFRNSCMNQCELPHAHCYTGPDKAL